MPVAYGRTRKRLNAVANKLGVTGKPTVKKRQIRAKLNPTWIRDELDKHTTERKRTNRLLQRANNGQYRHNPSDPLTISPTKVARETMTMNPKPYVKSAHKTKLDRVKIQKKPRLPK